MTAAELAYPIATGAPNDLYKGRDVLAASGYNIDPTQRHGALRPIRGRTTRRPGAFTPKTTRNRYDFGRAQDVGTGLVSGALDRVRAGFSDHGPTGSRVPWHGSRPTHAGLNPGERMTLRDTPAMTVMRSAVARTGGAMRLGSYFTGPGDQVPVGLRRPHDPYPAPPPPTTRGGTPQPVAVLPGTPGAQPGPVGVRSWWGHIQNVGQAQAAMSPAASSPLPTQQISHAYPGSPTPPMPVGESEPMPDPYETISLPLDAPGSQHVATEAGDPSYTNAPGYPSYQSPWGYQGSERIGQPSDNASNSKKTLAIAGVAAAGAIVLFAVARKRKRRK